MKSVIVPDTSVIIEGWLSRNVENGALNGVKIIIPQIVIAEIEYQANIGKASGLAGLEELKRLRDLANKGLIELEVTGQRLSLEDLAKFSNSDIDYLIREEARKLDATLITSDRIQATLAYAEGIDVKYVEVSGKKVKLEDFFDDQTMSVHLKEGVPPLAKKGTPGNWRLVKMRDEPMTIDELQSIAVDIIERAKSSSDAFIEIDEPGATVIQLGEFRIAIARPPFSDGMEITAVRPLVKLKLEDYGLSEKLMKRLKEKAEGILIAGPPGAGKSTFASALAEFYMRLNRIVKTIERPRDLQVPPEVTQYTALKGKLEKTADVLLLVRPDYCIFDELRKDEDFKIFTDLRFAGVGMVGVIHATNPIDAIQRFIGRVHIGMLSRVIDTVIFIENGKVEKVYSLRLTVKVPTGMRDVELARPVVEIRDFETGELEYEIYVFGEQIVVAPVKERRRKRRISEEEQEVDREFHEVNIQYTNKYFVLILPPSFARKNAEIYGDDTFLFCARVNKRGEIHIRKKSSYGQLLMMALRDGARLRARIAD
ncbi:MAG: PINc/VapC family ATPase [Candidatus Baldrarchaeia archaeon]